jgi:large subunit ribosomal protein L6
MSRIGKRPIQIPDKVRVAVEGRRIVVEGPLGSLDWELPEGISITVDDGVIRLSRDSDDRTKRALHGLAGALVRNMVEGVERGFSKSLELVGVGYRAASKGNGVELSLGYSHPIYYEPPEGVQIEVPAPNKLVVRGIDKQKVGQVAADLRRFRPPEPYKGKGVRYEGETIRRKAGKASA